MELINTYKGAVFFVDNLGISNLTNGQISLKNEDYRQINDKVITWREKEKSKIEQDGLL